MRTAVRSAARRISLISLYDLHSLAGAFDYSTIFLCVYRNGIAFVCYTVGNRSGSFPLSRSAAWWSRDLIGGLWLDVTYDVVIL